MSEKKRALMVGDRCRAYSVYGIRSGKVKRVEADGDLLLEYDKESKEMSGADSGTFHPKQCRRLRRQRRVWIRNKHLNGISLQVSSGLAVTCVDRQGDPEWTEFREVVRGRK